MTKISLRAYNREIEGLIEHGERLDEAVAHCRHILKTYPKHLETYRLLGKAYLEAKRYDQAVDIFGRVLVSAPEDFVSHVGMSIIADEQGRLDEAIWHMERAFEVQPSNAAIQGELQRLFGRRDGVEPPRIRLTRGALARMYVQGELYNQAISEIRAVLGQDPKRTDLQVLLADAYFRNGQKTDAADGCAELLGQYPYCLDANRLMTEILPGAQGSEAGQQYRQRVSELDPYATFAAESVFHTETVADGAVTLERLDYTGQAKDTGAVLGIELEPTSTPADRSARESKWIVSPRADELAGSHVPESDSGVPDFLRDAGWSASGREVADAAQSVAPAPEFVPAAVPADLPAWVKALAPADESEGPEQAPYPLPNSDNRGTTLGPSGTGGMTGTESPSWLSRLGASEVAERLPGSDADSLGPKESEGGRTGPTGLTSPRAAEDTPGWLRHFDNDLFSGGRASDSGQEGEPVQPGMSKSVSSLGSLGTTEQEQEDALAWLESLAAKHGANPEELVTDPAARKDVVPEWVDKARELEGPRENAAAPPLAVNSSPQNSLRDNLNASWSSGEGEQTEVPQGLDRGGDDLAKQPSSDWLAGLADQNAFAGMEAQNEQQEAPIMDEADVPDRLSDLAPQPSQGSPVGSQPSWLGRDAGEPQFGQSSEVPQSDDKSKFATDLPDWLAGLDGEQSPAAAAEAEAASAGLPDWLQPQAEAEAHNAERTRPADWQPLEMGEIPGPQISAGTPAVEPSSAAGAADARGRPNQPRAGSDLRTPVVVRPRATPSLQRAEEASLVGAHSELGRGNIAAALDMYGRLIRKGRSLEDIIRDLRDALYRYPVEVPIWQALGDAYMRANRLQEALDAYTKAEELLR
jgi:tetratricopeptide (TPR) repeat protein